MKWMKRQIVSVKKVDPDAHIIFGSTFDESLHGRIRVSCVATGIDAHVNHVINKARISQMEAEMQEAIQVESSIETIGLLSLEQIAANLESGEPGLNLKEGDKASCYSEGQSSEDSYRYASSTQEEDRPLSFFDRLMGRKVQGVRRVPGNCGRSSRPQPTVQHVDV